MRRVRLLVVLPAAFVLLAAACTTQEGGDGGGEEGDTGTVNVLNAVEPEENEILQSIADELINSETDYQVEFEQSGNFEEQAQIRAEGGTLDTIILPQPGGVADFIEAGAVSLEDLGIDVAALEETYGEYLMSLGMGEDGQHYGVPTNTNFKSMIWYPKDDFDAAGYEIPTTFDELIALSDQIVEDGSSPWCVGFQSEGSTGWPATDWMEDIMLRTAGPEVYDQWVAHEIPFNDPAVEQAGELFGQVMFTEGYVLGGAENTTSIDFGDAPAPMFDDPPGCWLHRQASFINAFFPEDAEAGVDYDWFPFPAIDQEGALFAGELTIAFRNTPEIRDFMERFASQEVQCAMGGEPGSARLSGNIDVGPDCYANEILADASVVLTEAISSGTGRFDASDLMPAEVGAGSFWSGMVEYVQSGPDALPGVLEEIEASFPQQA